MKHESHYPINDLLLKRTSPRAFSGESITHQELTLLFEAARWAPSSYNNQPWRFVYAVRDTQEWNILFDLLVPFNQEWCKNGAALIVIISANNFAYNQKPSRTHSFDTGAAWENLALQATTMGLVAHGMEGFNYDRAREVLNIPDEHTVEAMCCIGRPGPLSVLPTELQVKEVASDRKPLESFVFHGVFGKSFTN